MKKYYPPPRPRPGAVRAYLEGYKPKQIEKEVSIMAKTNNEGWVSVKPNFIKLGDGEGEVSAVQGVFAAMDYVEIEGKSVPRYTITNEDSARVSFLGTVQISQALATVNLGSEVRITYTGQDGKGSRRFKTFDIQTRAVIAEEVTE